MTLHRILDLTGREEGLELERKAHALEFFLMIHAVARLWMWAWPFRAGRPEELALAVGMSACLAFYLHRPSRRLAVCLAAVVLLTKQCITFPLASNHSFIECFTMTLFAFLGTRESLAQLTVLQTVRWLAVIVFFASGVQKVLYGTYFEGQYLAYSIGRHSRFLAAFGALIPAEELARIREQMPPRVGAGPFRVDALWFVVMSNIVYVFEIIAPIFLLIPKTRVLATIGCLIFTGFIEAGAREFMFGALYVNLMLLFLPRAYNRWLLPFWVVLYVALFGIEAEWWFADFYFN